MKGFIEVTRIYRDNPAQQKCLIAISAIKSIEVEADGLLFVVFENVDRKGKQPWVSLGYSIKETYNEVVAKIKEAVE